MIALADSRHADKPSQRRFAAATESKARQVGRSIQRAVRQEAMVIGVLAAVTLAAYGFELAHLGAALDDDYWELAGFTAPKWVREGRWGLHLLKTVLFPDRMPPLIPMLLGLAFSIAGILLLLRAWGIASRAQQIGFGAVALTFPGTVFSYVLPILGYGIGIGYFCIGLSLYMYARAVGHRKLMAFLPAAFAIAIYQQLLMALAMAFLIHLALLAFRKEPALGRHAAAIAAVNLLAIATYALGARLFLAIYATTPSPYITGRVELATLTSDPVRVLRGTMDAILAVYLGRTAAYGLRIPLMGILIGTALVGFAAHVWGLQRSAMVKLGLLAMALLIMLPPFGLGALTGGVLRMRWLPSLPMAVAGVTLLATLETRRGYQFVLTGVVAFAVFQFIQATNRLFASSYLALEADRVLAARIIDRLEAARTSLPEGSRPVYLQIVGYLEREPTELMPRAGDTVGYSIFESADTTWIAAFLGMLDYRELQPVPAEGQSEMIERAASLPAWPEHGSVAIMGDTVVLNLGGQAAPQKFTLCRQLGMAGSAEYDRLCGNETWRPGLSDQ